MASSRYALEKRKTFDGSDKLMHVVKIVLVILAVVEVVKSDETNAKDVDKDIVRRLKILEGVAGRSFGDVYHNGTFRTGNVLWDNILNKCTTSPSISCLQKNFYSYLDNSLEFNGDVNVFSGVRFKKNNVDIHKYEKEANTVFLERSKDSVAPSDEENEIEEDDEPESPLEEVTDALYGKGVNFLMTHDMRLTLPEFFFHGATLKISPRALTKTGALVHVDLDPKENNNGNGRIFFNKIKKYIKKKLVMAAIAIILIVKLIALKLIFVLPVIFGVTTAKKMFLKLLLFLFPALSHIFKLCSWYHQNYHTTKYHHHHHLITHHHKGPHHSYGHAHGSIASRPHHAEGPPAFEHYPQDWELSGPGLGSEYIASDIHRNAIANFKPHVNDVNDINAWGLGSPPGPSGNVGEYAGSNNIPNSIPSPNPQRVPTNHVGRPVGPLNPYQRNKKTQLDPMQAEKEALLRAAALAARAPPSPVRDEILRVSAVKLTENNRIKTETDLVKQQQEILASQDPETISAEKFYGTLLERIDTILNPMANDFGCRERAICELYRDPFKHAPYSNLVSNELSKNSNELLPAGDSKMAIRYYRYVQAARDGQEQKDCLVIHSNCNIDYSS